MRFILDAIFDPEYQAATTRYFERGKANDEEGRRMRAEAMEANREYGFGNRGALTGRKISFRVKAGRQVTP